MTLRDAAPTVRVEGATRLAAGGGVNLSPHPVDQLIRELIRTGRAASPEEVEQVIERVSTAPFAQQPVAVPAELQDVPLSGQRLGPRARSLLVHLAQRILLDQQWAAGTTEQQYLSDLHFAVRRPSARIALYERRGGHVAGILAPNELPPDRRGAKALPWVYVVYSADRGTIISGYQASSVQEVDIPEGARWLR